MGAWLVAQEATLRPELQTHRSAGACGAARGRARRGARAKKSRGQRRGAAGRVGAPRARGAARLRGSGGRGRRADQGALRGCGILLCLGNKHACRGGCKNETGTGTRNQRDREPARTAGAAPRGVWVRREPGRSSASKEGRRSSGGAVVTVGACHTLAPGRVLQRPRGAQGQERRLQPGARPTRAQQEQQIQGTAARGPRAARPARPPPVRWRERRAPAARR